ncbi:MAG: WbqC family protein [Bacteroidales bacterium]|nr:WbqC family protein [Bacteroidales bacterium]MCM1146812.1 WbqC family protein [Bacteroidales bacterium]MCM1205690.1 WbqC family protein [Bacillota bacterium]MCM1510781.1 WbqC family protein [Clostridium sp.]
MILSTTYFGPVQWYSLLSRCSGSHVSIEACESFRKQTYRNRCVIATANGTQALTVPVTHGSSQLIKDIRISDHGNWRHLHWQALCTAYGESAFFEYYQDDIRPFFIDEGPSSPVHKDYLLDYNMASAELMCRLLDLDITFGFTEEFIPSDKLAEAQDYRYLISPKTPVPHNLLPAICSPQPYYQVYRERHGFLPGLSILDLLFNEGPEAVKYLL